MCGRFPDLDLGSGALARSDLHRLSDEAELDLIRKLAQFPRVVEASAEAHEPHRIGFYLYDLAGEFHGLWNRGKTRHNYDLFTKQIES